MSSCCSAVDSTVDGAGDYGNQFIQRPSGIANEQIRRQSLTKLFTILIFGFGNSIGKGNQQIPRF